MVKLVQVYFINMDSEMYSAEQNKYAKAFSSTLNEELGQIHYVFTDKTGTLTSNELVYKYTMIGNTFIGDTTFLQQYKDQQSKKQ